jgi:SAM-dependent methyltransferase
MSDDLYDQAFWDARYSEQESIWSGNPNPVLVADASGLMPGRALDIGSGEGADSIWLASRGWNVTGVDISEVALQRAASVASADPTVASRISWEHHDFLEWSPPEAAFDLVSAQYMHLASAENERLFRAMAAAVAPGGTLLIVGHHISHAPHDPHTSEGSHGEHMLAKMFTAESVVALLDASLFTIEASGLRLRPAGSHGAEMGMTHDVVVRARRHGGPVVSPG